VQFADKAAAEAALQALNGSTHLPQTEGGLVVERMDPNKQNNKAYGKYSMAALCAV
jgi:phage/plasmid primase-like uncharacterized protein